jgi:hypothetical protein
MCGHSWTTPVNIRVNLMLGWVFWFFQLALRSFAD